MTETYIDLGHGCVCGASSAQKKKNHVLKDKTRLTPNFKVLFSHHDVRKILSRRSGDYFIDIFSKDTSLAASMNEANSKLKGTKR